MRRPLIGLAAAGLAGAVIGLEFQPPAGWLLAGLGLLWCILAAGLWLPPPHGSRMALVSAAMILLVLGVAAAAATLAASPVSPADLRHAPELRTDSRATVTLVGVVAGDPTPVQRGQSFAIRFNLRTESVRFGRQARKARCMVSVLWLKPRDVPPPAYGERWEVRGRFTRLDPLALAASTYGAHFMARNQAARFRQYCEQRRREASGLLCAGIADHPDATGLLQALLVGTRMRLPAAIKQDFMATGTFHVVAISGLHVGMVCWLLASVLRLAGISRVWWFPILAPLLVVYTMGTGASASALRACIMAMLFFGAFLAGRKPDAPSALAAAALVIVAIDPFQVLDRGFILSFSLVGGLLLLAPLIARTTPAFLKPDPFLIDELIPAWKRAAYGAGRAVWSTAALSAASWLSSLPLTAYFFGNVSLVALPANLVAIPASFLIVLAGCFSVVFGSVWLPLAEVFNYANLALITVLARILDLLAAIPYACVPVPRPPLWVLPAWYAGLIFVALYIRSRPKPEETPFG